MSLEPTATHRLGHVSDSHFTASGTMHGAVRPHANFVRALHALEHTGVRLDAIVHTGDIADAGEPEAYTAALQASAPVLERTGWPAIWVAGNHDVRAALRAGLLGQAPSDAPLDAVTDLDGLRVVTLDTSIPGRTEGGLDEEQLDRLRDTLASPSEHGTVVALHHAPVPVEITALQPLHLTDQRLLGAVLEGSDVRAILGGHLHYATASVFAGIPVFVAPATAYTIVLTAPGGGLLGVDGGHAAGVLSLYDDGRVGYSAVPADPAVVVVESAESELEALGVNAQR